MKRVMLGIIVVAVVGGGIAAFVWNQRGTPEARREQLVDRFLACLPDSLDDQRRQEIAGLFDVFWRRADRGLIDDNDIDGILGKVEHYVEQGSIAAGDLVYLMAQVGYTTYKGEEKYNLPDGVVDHPTLNPDAATATLWPDTTGYAQWYAEQLRKKRAALEASGEVPDSASAE